MSSEHSVTINQPLKVEKQLPEPPFQTVKDARHFCDYYGLRLDHKTIPHPLERATATAWALLRQPELAKPWKRARLQ